MRRREFIALLGGAGIAGPFWRNAAAAERVRRIGVMMQIPESDPEARARLNALREALRDRGWTEGRNLQIEYRDGAGRVDEIQSRAADLIATDPDIIFGNTNVIIRELQRQTSTIPILFVNLNEPLELGIVPSLARPGGNTTGFMGSERSLGGKWLSLLLEVAPDVRRVLVLGNPASSGNQRLLDVVQSSAPIGVRVSSAIVREGGDVEKAIGEVAREPGAGLISLPGGPTTVHRERIIAQTMRHRVPAIYAFRYYAMEGGLMSYGADVLDMWRRSASYVDRILRGERPSELPVQAPTKFQFVVNLKTAKALGLKISESFLLRADEVIE